MNNNMKSIDRQFINYLFDSVSKENIMGYVSKLCEEPYMSLFFGLTDMACDVHMSETGEKRLRTDISPTDCFVVDLDDEDVYILGKIGPVIDENDDSSNEEIWIYRNSKKNKRAFDSELVCHYNLSQNELANKLILKVCELYRNNLDRLKHLHK